MATTNTTTNYGLSQYVGSDVTSYLTNYNSDMTKIDAQMKRNADSAATANDNATIAVSTATTAASDASTALSTANTASSTAATAQTAAQDAQTAAGAAQTDAAAALRASASNSIGNLAPAYDPTLTYNVGDLVTYVDADNSGKLYKCIVAIATPEAFNINKWDDVTTSEAYISKSEYQREINFDGVKTVSEVITELVTTIASDIPFLFNSFRNGKIIEMGIESDTNKFCCILDSFSFDGTNFNINATRSDINFYNQDTTIETITAKNTGTFGFFRKLTITNAGVISFTDLSSSVEPATNKLVIRVL